MLKRKMNAPYRLNKIFKLCGSRILAEDRREPWLFTIFTEKPVREQLCNWPDGKFRLDWPFTIYSKTPNLPKETRASSTSKMALANASVFSLSDNSVGNFWITFQEVPLISKISSRSSQIG